MAIQVINPATGKIIKTFEPEHIDIVDKKLDHANRAFHQWKKLSIEERGAVIQKVADDLEKNKESYAKIITTEMGKPKLQAIAEIEKSAKVCEYYANNSRQFLTAEHIATGAQESYVMYEPLGTILGVMPWNYPFTQVFRAAVPALMAGNTFVLKHASNVPWSAITIEKIFAKATNIKNIFTTVLIEGSSVKHLVGDNRIAAVTLTGGEKAGKRVAELAGSHLKKTVMELGGSDAFIVLDDVDIKSVVEHAIKAKSLNAGQSCNSPKRFILMKSIADEFKKHFIEKVKNMKFGNPSDETVDIGPIARDNLRQELHKQVQNSIKKGAKLLLGGRKIAGDGYFYELTLLDEVTKGMPVYDEEVFGPVAIFIEVKNEEEAIRVANDTHLGLNATVWTADIRRAKKFIEELQVGSVFVNQVVRSDPRLPYGGTKKSGYGREFGMQGIREFTNIKAVVVK
ncbi:NAD-dependent succinate-semialdehyde dehydrogenase [soil metagenome]